VVFPPLRQFTHPRLHARRWRTRAVAPGATPAGYVCVDKFGKTFMSENQLPATASPKEYLLFFDGINRALFRIPCTTSSTNPPAPAAPSDQLAVVSGAVPAAAAWAVLQSPPLTSWSATTLPIEKGWITWAKPSPTLHRSSA